MRVLNVNDLAIAVRPILLPGEELTVRLIKKGKEIGQAVGYLEDGTMVVVDDASNKIGSTVTCAVTSVLQTTAGRLVFTKLKGASTGGGWNSSKQGRERHRSGSFQRSERSSDSYRPKVFRRFNGQ